MHTRQKKIINVLVALGLTAVLAAGCENGPRVQMAPGYETTPTRVEVDANVMGTPDPTPVPPTPTPEPLALDDTLYTHASKTFSLYVPQGWKMAAEDSDYVKFEAFDQKAWFEAVVESTGYQLEQEALANYVKATMAFLYKGVEDFETLESQVEEGQIEYVSTFRKEGVIWFVYDVFIQRSQAVYAMSFWAYEQVWEAYRPGFKAVIASLETSTGYVSDEMIYTQRRTYASPNNQFTLQEVPMGWTFKLGLDSTLGAVVDVIESPDGQAQVQIAVYDGTVELQTIDIGQIAIPIMKELNGDDIRIRANDVLTDSRIRTDWQVDAESMYGFSFFWQDQSIVYVLTFRYTDKQTGAYQTMAYIIGDSFAFSQ